MYGTVTVEPLAAHIELLTTLQQWFEAEWPSYYGTGGPGDAGRDLRAFANEADLPVGIVAFQGGKICGVAALKAESIPSHRHLSPWAAAGFVLPTVRGRGIGAQLLLGLEQQARKLDFREIYCGTGTADSLLQRCAWVLLERVTHDGQDLAIYRKAL